MGKQNDLTAESVELSTKDGQAFIEQATPLTRLHYFDGKFLKADALAQEQAYHRTQVQLANLAGGWGVVHGLGVSLAGDQLNVGGGLAVTPAGHFVLTVGDVQAKVADLLKVAAPTPALGGNTEPGPCNDNNKGNGVTETAAMGLYEITVGPIEGLCGNEAVYGALCESACVSDSRHPYWREGLVLRLRPITLKLPVSSKVPFSTTHLRNRVASAYFALEPGSTSSALSASGLASGVWCQPASLYGRDEVVIGLLAREGGVNRVLDAWSGRRERMEAQARGYWQGRMAMRPWNVYLAQILQFQCQLSGVFDDTSVVVTVPDHCDDIRAALDQTRKDIAALHKKYADSASKLVEAFGGNPTKAEAKQLADEVKLSYAELFELSEKLSGVEAGQGALPKNRLLLDSGFVQLPPAGYLPVQPGKTALPEQLQRMFGEGVRLHYRVARADVLPHLLEEAQHMERISLTKGIDQPDALEDVEVFVPDGLAIPLAAQATGTWWDTSIDAMAGKLLGLLTKDTYQGNDTLGNDTFGNATSVPGSGNDSSSFNAFRDEQPMSRLASSGFRQIVTRTLSGLSRTESREDGTFGLTLVVASQPAPEPFKDDVIATPAPASFRSGNRDASFVSDEDPAIDISAYLAADIQTDPFALGIGDETPFKAELRLLAGLPVDQGGNDTLNPNDTFTGNNNGGINGTSGFTLHRMALVGRLTGTLSVINKQVKAQGRTLLLAELRGPASTSIFVDDKDPKEQDNTVKFRLLLARQGDGSTGILMVDDALQDKRVPPIALKWDGQPKVATVTVDTSSKVNDTLGGGHDTINHIYTGGDDQALELARLRALSQAPLPASAIGADALSTLVALSDATDDPAFLVRARKRLFPTLEASEQVQIQAVLDWVLFRRKRPTFCDPVCAAPVRAEVEAFQVWHTRIASKQQLKQLQTALDQGDANALAEFKFQPVGVLRYRQDDTQHEESAAKVLAMWQHAKPGSQVVLGRSWETRPTAGQGWQNHFRLRAMLDEISALTKPPTRGDGAIATLPLAPAPLNQGALDGGMLVATVDAGETPEPVKHKHRVIFMTDSLWSDIEPALKRKADTGWKAALRLLKATQQPTADLTIDMADNQPTPASLKQLQDADAAYVNQLGEGPFAHDGASIDGQTIDPSEKPDLQHAAVFKAVGATPIGAYKLETISDLGAGVHEASIIVLRQITPQ